MPASVRHRRKTWSRARLLACAIGTGTILAGPGCRQEFNARSPVAPEAWSIRAEIPPVPEARVGLAMSEATVPLDRQGWARPSTYSVPLDGVAHSPLHTRPLWRTKSQARQLGEHPTMESALQLSEASHDREALEMPLAQIGAARDLLFMPFQMILQKRHRPGAVLYSPAWPFERQPGGDPLVEGLRPPGTEPPPPSEPAPNAPASGSPADE